MKITFRALCYRDRGPTNRLCLSNRDCLSKCVHFTIAQIHGEDRILEFTKDCDDLLTDRQLNELRSRITLIKLLPTCVHAERYDKAIID